MSYYVAKVIYIQIQKEEYSLIVNNLSSCDTTENDISLFSIAQAQELIDVGIYEEALQKIIEAESDFDEIVFYLD